MYAEPCFTPIPSLISNEITSKTHKKETVSPNLQMNSEDLDRFDHLRRKNINPNQIMKLDIRDRDEMMVTYKTINFSVVCQEGFPVSLLMLHKCLPIIQINIYFSFQTTPTATPS